MTHRCNAIDKGQSLGFDISNNIKFGVYMKKTLVILITYLISFSAFCSEKMVYMYENNSGKHIMMADANGENIKQVTSGDLWHLYPDITPAADEVVFIQGEGEGKLYPVTYNFKNRAMERWSNQSANIFHPKFANNGRVLFYSAPHGQNSTQSIVYVNIHQARKGEFTETQIQGQTIRTYQFELKSLNESYPAYFPNPSSDASFVIYHRNIEEDGQKRREVVLYDMMSGEKKIIDEGMAPSLSKDDRYVAYTKLVAGNWDVFIWDRYTGKITRQTVNPEMDFAPVFKSDGSLVFARSSQDGNFDFYQMTPNTSNESILLNQDEGSVYAARFSGDTSLSQVELPAIPGEARSSFGAIYHQNKVYIAGGHKGAEHTYPPESFSNKFQVYDLATKSWSELAPRLHKCHGFQIVGHGKYIYAFGGFAYSAAHTPKWKSLDVIERYDIELNKWEIVGKMPRRRSSNVSIKVGDKVYLMGGWDSTPKFEDDIDGTFHSEVDVFDLKSETVTANVAELPKKRRAFSAIVKDNKIILVGGISEGGSHFSLLADVTQFDPQSLEFSEIAKLPYATFAPATGLLNNELVVFGGMYKTSGDWSYEYVTQVTQFDFKTGMWRNSGRQLLESKGFSQVVQMPAGVGVLGGHTYMNQQDAPVATFEFFSVK